MSSTSDAAAFGANLGAVTRGLIGAGASAGTAPGPAAPGSGPAAPPKVYRQRIYHAIPYGHFNDVLTLCERLNAIIVRRGGRPAGLWMPTIGQQNHLAVEFEFTDLGAFGRGRAAANADPEWTGLIRQIGAAVEPGSVYTDLWETATHLAQ